MVGSLPHGLKHVARQLYAEGTCVADRLLGTFREGCAHISGQVESEVDKLFSIFACLIESNGLVPLLMGLDYNNPHSTSSKKLHDRKSGAQSSAAAPTGWPGTCQGAAPFLSSWGPGCPVDKHPYYCMLAIQISPMLLWGQFCDGFAFDVSLLYLSHGLDCHIGGTQDSSLASRTHRP